MNLPCLLAQVSFFHVGCKLVSKIMNMKPCKSFVMLTCFQKGYARRVGEVFDWES